MCLETGSISRRRNRSGTGFAGSSSGAEDHRASAGRSADAAGANPPGSSAGASRVGAGSVGGSGAGGPSERSSSERHAKHHSDRRSDRTASQQTGSEQTASERSTSPGSTGPGHAKTRERHGTSAAGPEQQLVEKLHRIEALYARAGSEGERVAAERARERIKARLEQLAGEEPPVEFRFSLADQWSRHLFIALLRRYGISPYRYRGQRRTTVMASMSRSFMNDTLWPEFQELHRTLAAYFDALTARVIEQALGVKAGEAEERQTEPASTPELMPVDHQGSLL